MQQDIKRLPDLELAVACAQGDRIAQRYLFERVKNVMFGICLRFSDSREDAEDLLQEGFIRVFRDIEKFRGEGSLDGWIRKVFVRLGIEYYHRKQGRPQIVEIEWIEHLIAERHDAFDTEGQDNAIKLLQQLPPGFRAVLNLAVLEDKSHEEIARELGISAGTSRSQLARAKEFLRKILQKTLVLI